MISQKHLSGRQILHEDILCAIDTKVELFGRCTFCFTWHIQRVPACLQIHVFHMYVNVC